MQYQSLNFVDWGPEFAWALPLILAAVIWSLVWKGMALWRAAHNDHKAWFVVLLIINTVGILEIIYLLTSGKRQQNTFIPKM